MEFGHLAGLAGFCQALATRARLRLAETAMGFSVLSVATSQLGAWVMVYTGISILSFTFTRKPMPLTLSCQSQIARASLRW